MEKNILGKSITVVRSHQNLDRVRQRPTRQTVTTPLTAAGPTRPSSRGRGSLGSAPGQGQRRDRRGTLPGSLSLTRALPGSPQVFGLFCSD